MAPITCIKTLKIPIWMLKKSSLWPEKTFTKTLIFKLTLIIILHVTVYTFLVLDVINAIKLNDIKFLNWVTGILIPLTNYYAKAIAVVLKRKCFFSILEDLKCDIFNSHSEKLNKYIQLIYRVSRIITRYLAITIGAYVLTFSILPFLTDGLMIIPPPFETGKFDIPYKIIHFFSCCYIGYNNGVFDVLYLSLIALCMAQLKILGERLHNIMQDAVEINKENKLQRDLDMVLDDLLRQCIILHEKINQFLEKLNVLLSLPLFVQYVSGCFVLCSSIIQITIGGKTSKLVIVGLCGYNTTILGQLFAYHYLGNEIVHMSNRIVESTYLSNWYELNLKLQKRITVLMERSKRPLIITAYKFVFISLASLGVIVQWSYSLFAVIKANYR